MIVPTTARLIVREHLHRPLLGKVLTLGRQTIAMTFEEIKKTFAEEGYVIPESILKSVNLKRDEETRMAKGKDYVSDEVFFGLLGVKDLHAMDVSTYEAADIIHNLNQPIPETLANQFDFIVDGGTFDHCFDLKTAFQNVTRLLKPGGRILQWNSASNYTGCSYISFGPDFFYDYFILNQFADCKVYIAEVDTVSQPSDWDFYLFNPQNGIKLFTSSRLQMVVVLAEKGAHSTYDKVPVQPQYRDAELWEPYRAGERLIQQSGRKPWTEKNRHSMAGAGQIFRKQQGSRGWKKVAKEVRDRIPSKLKGNLPMDFKRDVNSMLREKTELRGFKYVGRI